jgi:Flp pilus assembly protein TadD
MGRFEEAIALQRRAVEQNPLSAEAYFRLGCAFLVADRPAEAVAAMRMALELAPNRSVTRGWLSIVLFLQGCSEEAQAEALREPSGGFRLLALAIIHHAAGRRTEADAALQELTEKYADVAAHQIAQAYAAWARPDRAFEWLERAHAQRIPGSHGRWSTRSSAPCTQMRGGILSCARWGSRNEVKSRLGQ